MRQSSKMVGRGSKRGHMNKKRGVRKILHRIKLRQDGRKDAGLTTY